MQCFNKSSAYRIGFCKKIEISRVSLSSLLFLTGLSAAVRKRRRDRAYFFFDLSRNLAFLNYFLLFLLFVRVVAL